MQMLGQDNSLSGRYGYILTAFGAALGNLRITSHGYGEVAASSVELWRVGHEWYFGAQIADKAFEQPRTVSPEVVRPEVVSSEIVTVP